MKDRLRIRNIITGEFAEAPTSGFAEAMQVRVMLDLERDLALQWLSTRFGNRFSLRVGEIGEFSHLIVEVSENGEEFKRVPLLEIIFTESPQPAKP